MKTDKILLRFLKNQSFIFGLFISLALGIISPGVNETLNPGSITSTVIIVILFFNTGITLPSESILKGLFNYKLHLYSQGFIFILTPLFYFISVSLLSEYFSPNMIIGIYAVAVLPTTISSCIVFTHACNGDTVGTMFNAALSNILGIVISPLLLSMLLHSSEFQTIEKDLSQIFLRLFFKMVVPVFLGQLVHQYVKKHIFTFKNHFSRINNFLILVLSFFAFSKTAQNKAVFSEVSVFPFIFLAVSYLLLLALSYGGSKALNFSKKEQISIVFSAPQKTLAMGFPLLSAYLASSPDILGIAILPLIFYYPWQLFIAALLKNRIS